MIFEDLVSAEFLAYTKSDTYGSKSADGRASIDF